MQREFSLTEKQQEDLSELALHLEMTEQLEIIQDQKDILQHLESMNNMLKEKIEKYQKKLETPRQFPTFFLPESERPCPGRPHVKRTPSPDSPKIFPPFFPERPREEEETCKPLSFPKNEESDPGRPYVKRDPAPNAPRIFPPFFPEKTRENLIFPTSFSEWPSQEERESLKKNATFPTFSLKE